MTVGLNQISTKRECGECGVCCVVAEVKEGDFNKPACVSCPYLNKTDNKREGESQGKKSRPGRCGIFGDKKRPIMCSSYECAWKRGLGNKDDRPDKNGVMLSINNFNGGNWIFVLDIKKDAHKTTGKNIIIETISKFNLPAIVLDNDNLKDGKGDFVILTKEMESRSSQIMGDFIEELGDLKVYKLIVS